MKEFFDFRIHKGQIADRYIIRSNVMLVIGLICLSSLFVNHAISQNDPILAFSATDQFDSLHTEKDYLGRVTIITGSDRGGSQYNGIWHKAIHDSLGNRVNISKINFLPVADVSSVPFFLKGLVKGKFSQTKAEWVLLDWKGYFADAYHFAEDSTNIVIIDKNGRLIYKTAAQALDSQKLNSICNKIIDLVQSSH